MGMEKVYQMLTTTVKAKRLQQALVTQTIMERTERVSQMLTTMVKVKPQKVGLMRMIGQNMRMIQKAGGIVNTVPTANTVMTAIMEKMTKTLIAAGGFEPISML